MTFHLIWSAILAAVFAVGICAEAAFFFLFG